MSDELKQSFYAFCSYGTRETVTDIDNVKFAKLCKDAKIVGAGLTTTDVDLAFSKVKDKTARRINFAQFVEALGILAGKKKITEDAIHALVIAAKPVTNATKAEAVKYHDDKSLYTGVYANGGPTNVDKDRGGAQTLSGLCDRSSADVRGVKYTQK